MYEANSEAENKYRVFKLNRDNILHEKDEKQMKEMEYPGEPHGKYAVYTIDEEVAINAIYLWEVLTKHRIDKNIDYSPIFISGKELMEYVSDRL